MLKIAICEDDSMQRKSIVYMIEKYLDVIYKRCKTFEFISGEKLLSSIDKFDIYFLDIQMDKLSGIETAKQIRMGHENSIKIFIT